MAVQNLKKQADAYHSLIFGKGHSTSVLYLSAKEAYSLLAENEQMLKRFQNHGFTPMENPYFDPTYDFNKKVTCKGILIHNFFVKAKEMDDGEGNSIIRPLKSPCYRHFLKYANSTYLNKVPNHVPFKKKFNSGEMHETIIPAEYVFMPFDKDGNINPDLASIYRGTKPGTEQALHWSQVSIKYGLESNKNNAKNAFFNDKNIKRTVFENLIDGKALFEVHAVSLVYQGYADHNRMTDYETKKLKYPKPDLETRYGYVDYFNVSAAIMGIKLHQRSFHNHAGATHVLKQGQKELQESNIKQLLSEKDKKETEELLEPFKNESNSHVKEETQHVNNASEETHSTDNAAEDISEFMPEELGEERHVLKKGNIHKLVGTKFYELLEELEENDFYSFLLFMMDNIYKPLIKLACEAKEETTYFHIVQLNGAVYDFLNDLDSKKESPEKVISFKSNYSSLEDINEVLNNTLSSGGFDMDDLEDDEEDEKDEEETQLQPQSSSSELKLDLSFMKRECLFSAIKDDLMLEEALVQVNDPSLEDIDYLVKAFYIMAQEAGMETSFSFDEISNLSTEDEYREAGNKILASLGEIDEEEELLNKVKAFSKRINSFEEVKAYVDGLGNSSDSLPESESSNEDEIEQASDDPELLEELEQLAAEAKEEEEQESNNDDNVVDGNNVDLGEFFS